MPNKKRRYDPYVKRKRKRKNVNTAPSTEMPSIDNLQNVEGFIKRDPIESDEESLHLLLESDDDPPKNLAMETEDDILNKFEPAAGSDASVIDAKSEEHLLNEDFDHLDTKIQKKEDLAEMETDQINNPDSNLENSTEPETERDNLKTIHDDSLKTSGIEVNDFKSTDSSEENKENCERLVNGDIKDETTLNVNCEKNKDFDVENKVEEEEKETCDETTENATASENINDLNKCNVGETRENDKNNLNENEKDDKNNLDEIKHKNEENGKENLNQGEEKNEEDINEDLEKIEKNGKENSFENEDNIQENANDDKTENIKEAAKDNETELSEIQSDSLVNKKENTIQNHVENEYNVEKTLTDNVEESQESNQASVEKNDYSTILNIETDENIAKDKNSKGEECETNDLKIVENKLLIEDESRTSLEESKENLQSVPDDKCEDNSNDSSKCNNLDSEDLLDISIIRDTEDDDASAIAEIQADAKEAEEKAENDEQESGSDRNDAEDDIDLDKEADQMDIDDTVEPLETDIDMEKGSDDVSTVNKDSIHLENSECDVTEKETVQDKLNETELINKADDELENETELPVSSKRPMDNESESSSAKKLKLDDGSEEILQMAHKEVIKSLKKFSSFMKDRNLSEKLTRSDLEQFVMQKICEVIMHKTAAGDMHLTIRKHEQTIDNLRKDVVQLSKQCRDLEIVNKKLLNELKAQTSGGNKPLVPLKITRSVGLQVKLGVNIDNKRRLLSAVPSSLSKTGVVQITSPQKSPRVTPNILKTVTTTAKPASTVKAAPLTTTAAPLLTQALQTKRTLSPVVAKRTNTATVVTPPTRQVKVNNATNSVIDLTAEDDKIGKTTTAPNQMGGAFKTIALNSVKTIPLKSTGIKPGTTLPAGIRVTPGKNGSITLPAGVMTSTPLMYVVQNSALSQGIVTTTAGSGQKVFLNLQPTNGVLTSALNGSAVSVFQKSPNATPPLKRKHPAPLPVAPVYRSDTSLKPIPPKPHLTIRKTDNGIILQWKMPYNLDLYEAIASYQLYAYQETPSPPSTEMWRRVGDVKALALPMACTLTQFADKNRYYFAVRSVDVHKRIGPFSDPEEISL